jgi:hypothetical protein
MVNKYGKWCTQWIPMSPFKRVYWFLGRVVISKSNLAFERLKDAASTQRFKKKLSLVLIIRRIGRKGI